jgi:streptogramin lyase
MKVVKIITTICMLILCIHATAQNVGINNTNPQAALDLQGDLRLRSAILTLPDGLRNNVDLVTTKSSVYMFAGAALTGVQITGFTGGIDGRIATIFNNSTVAAVQLYDASAGASASSDAENRILTGTGNNAIININGSVTMRYDGVKQKWIVMSSAFTDGLSTTVPGGGPWIISGNKIFNSNTGNIGMGTNSPKNKLEINSGAVNQSGLRLTQYASTTTDVNITDVFADVTSVTGLAFDNSGNCYATNFNGNKIQKITADGAVTDFVTTNLNGPHDIVFGPDGNLYVSNFFGGTISKITLAGIITTFASGFSNPVGLTFDMNNFLFVVNYSNGQLSKVSPTGAFITYDFGTGLTSPYGCVYSATNDKIYIANFGADEIAEINFLFGGAKTTFKSGITACTGINIDASANVYAAQAAPNKVVKITQAGVVTDYANTTYPFDITFNNGKLYIANQTTNKVSVLNAVSNFLAVDNAGDVVRIKAGNLLQTTGQAFSNSWTVAGNNISNSNTGDVSIGTTSSSAKLTVQGDAALTGTPLVFSNLFGEYVGGGLKIFHSSDGRNLKIDGSTIQAFNLGGAPFFATSTSPLFINPFGNKVNIGTTIANNARVAIKRGTFASANDGSLALIGTTFTSYFHYGVNEDTYIRGGKAGSNIIIGDVEGGNVGIGTSLPDEKLSVKGKIRSQEIIVETANWPDYVFDKKYNLPSLKNVEAYINEHKHLQDIPSAKEIEKAGLQLGDVQKKMMQKIEELTLYIIEQNKRIEKLEAEKLQINN